MKECDLRTGQLTWLSFSQWTWNSAKEIVQKLPKHTSRILRILWAHCPLLTDGCKIRGVICVAAKRKENFIVTHTHHMIFNFASKEKGLISPLCNTPEVRVFNFYFSLRLRSFHEQALIVYCFWEFIKSTTRCLVFCFTAQFTRTFYYLFSLLSCCRRNIASVITLVDD